MARSISTIQAGIIANIRANPTLATLDSTSTTALYVLLAYVVAVAIATVENLFDLYRVELRELLAVEGPHTLRYYQGKALAYRLGVDLLPGTTIYPVNTADAIVVYASVREAGDTVEVKVAKENIEPLTVAELDGFTDYMNEVKDAGVRLSVTSEPADRLKATIDIRYNPQVLDSSGRRLDGDDDQVVYNAIVAYTESLRFDGQFVSASLVDALQQTEGIQVPTLRSVSIAPNGDPQFVQAGAIYLPASGFVRVYAADDLTINYIPYADA